MQTSADTHLCSQKSELRKLWDVLPHLEGTVVRWMAKRGTTNVRGDFVTSLRELEMAVRTYEGWNFYVAPNPSTSRVGVRHSAADVSHWSWMLIDMDPMWETGYDAPTALDEALLWLGEWMGYELVPFRLDSGRGAQAWIRLGDSLLDADRMIVSRTMRYWLHRLDEKLGELHGCRVDTTSSDLPRVMRCPGTVNQRTGRMAQIVQIGTEHVGLGTRLITGVPPEVFDEPEVQGDFAGQPWQFVVSYLTIKAKTFLTAGWQEPGRHEAMWHTAKRLQESGVSREETHKALLYGNTMCRNGLGALSPLSNDDINHVLKGVYG